MTLSNRLIYFFAAFSLLAYFFFANPPQGRIHEAQSIAWTESPQCPAVQEGILNAEPTDLFNGMSALRLPASKRNVVACKTTEITASTNVLRFVSTPGFFAPLRVGVRQNGNPDLQPAVVEIQPQPAGDRQTWEETLVYLPRNVTGAITLEFQNVGRIKKLTALLNRVDLVRMPGGAKSWREISSNRSLQVLISALAAIALAALFIIVAKQQNLSTAKLLLLFFSISVLVHFRNSTYFYWDEWSLLERFKSEGLSTVMRAHNEHFKPLFFIFLYVEMLLFRHDYSLYLLAASMLHAVNTLLLYGLLRRLCGFVKASETTARLLAFLFVVSALHVEVTQWAFEQCILLYCLTFLVAMNGAFDFLANGSRKGLFSCIAAVLLSPFFFGTGLIASFFVGTICVFLLLQDRLAAPRNSQLIKRSGVCLLSAGVMTGLGALAYTFAKDLTYQQRATPAEMLSNIGAVFKYFFTGTQIGTVLRGSGVILTLDPKDLAPILERAIDPQLFLALAAVAVSFAFLLVPLRAATRSGAESTARKSDVILLWLLGQAILALAFALPTLGRWSLGPGQALSLRYTYAALFGFCIFAIPLVRLISWNSNRKFYIMGLNPMVTLCITFYLFSNLLMLLREEYFTGKGKLNRPYVERLLVQSDGPQVPGPLRPSVMTPGIGDEHVRSEMSYLN